MTEYVMVPVPEELADEVMRFMMVTDMKRVSEVSTNLTVDTVVNFVRHLNPRCREVLLVLSDAVVAGSNLTISELARTMRWPEHETFGVVHELRDLVWEVIGPTMSLVAGAAPDAETGALDWGEQTVFLWKDLSTAVVAAEEQLAAGA